VNVVQRLYLDIVHDTTICKGKKITLMPRTNADRLKWHNGYDAPSFTTWDAGTYWVRAYRQSCSTTDTIHVHTLAPPVVYLGHDTLICDSFELELDAGPGASYQWYPNGESSRKVSVSTRGTYTVIVRNDIGCEGTNSISISTECVPTLFVPNAFSPDFTHVNDLFRAYGTHIESYEMTIYNRWGERLFYTTDISKGWDGNYKNTPCGEGVYLYAIHYTGPFTNKQVTGSFHLLK
jgi:gliding motility-associated-like protein